MSRKSLIIPCSDWPHPLSPLQTVGIEQLGTKIGNSLLFPVPKSKIAEFGHKSGILGGKADNSLLISLLLQKKNVENTFLMLSQTIESLVGLGSESLLHLPSLCFEDRGYVKGFATLLWLPENEFAVGG
ncbi:MAG: hypothetical protein ACJ71Q_09640 [Terriglobales bacterium]